MGAVVEMRRDDAVSYRIAAIGDLHIWGKVRRSLFPEFETLRDRADVLVFTGDITNNGMLVQAERAAELLSLARIPIVAVMGNHDRRALLRTPRYCAILERAGVHFLDGTTFIMGGDSGRLGFAGVNGSGGGFWPDEGPDTLSRRTAQLLAVRARREAMKLDRAVSSLDTEMKVVITHVAPTMTTLHGEPKAKFWLLGNSEFGRVIDKHDIDLVFHGHAHRGNPFGRTNGGTPVCNVAQSVAGGIVFHELSPRAKPRLLQPHPRLIEARL
jgi:Icc-related predicted phosphoesterase